MQGIVFLASSRLQSEAAAVNTCLRKKLLEAIPQNGDNPALAAHASRAEKALADRKWEILFAHSQSIQDEHVAEKRDAELVHNALMQNLKDSVEEGLVHHVVGAKLAGLLYILYELRGDNVVQTYAEAGHNCILGFNRLKVNDNDAFMQQIKDLIENDIKYNEDTKDTDEEKLHQSMVCIYDLFDAIGMVIEHTTDLDHVGRRPDEYHHLAKIDNIHFDPALYEQNRSRMTSGELACWHFYGICESVIEAECICIRLLRPAFTDRLCVFVLNAPKRPLLLQQQVSTQRGNMIMSAPRRDVLLVKNNVANALVVIS